MNFPFYIAKRYLFSKSSNNAINIITIIATLGVIIGSLALFIVLSGFTGLKNFSLSFLNTIDPDVKITAVKGKSFLLTSKMANSLQKEKNIAQYSKVIQERALIEFNNKKLIATIKGVDTNYTKVNTVDTTVYVGTWLDKKIPNGVIIGNEIANQLSLGVFEFSEPLKIYVPKPGKGYISNPKNAFNTINTSSIGIYALTSAIDSKYIFSNIGLAKDLLNYKENQISAIEIKAVSEKEIPSLISNLKTSFGDNFEVKTRREQNATIYKMLNTENLVSYLLFTLVIIIALFNVVGAIIMMILDKKDNLKTLYNLGTNLKDLKKIFILQGILLTCFGLTIGISIGVTAVLLQKKYHFFMITQNLAYPVAFTWLNLITVIVTIIILGIVASKIASNRITQKLLS